jgi:quinol monooxygenase YgiN
MTFLKIRYHHWEDKNMIYVIATIDLKGGCKDAFLEIFHRNIPNVKAEKGCISYEPTVDVDSGLPIQIKLREDVVTIVEAWEDLDALQAHLKTPHMAAYREEVKDLVIQVSLQVLKPA